MSDRVMAMHEGRLTGILNHDDTDQAKITELAGRKLAPGGSRFSWKALKSNARHDVPQDITTLPALFEMAVAIV